MAHSPTHLFREEALRRRSQGSAEGQLLFMPQDWTRWTYWLLVAVFVAGIVYGVLGTVHEYATGPAVVRISEHDQRCSVVAVLPAHHRSRLRPGLPMRFEIKGYPHAYQELTITSVGAQIIGPNDAKRYLGPESQDTTALEGPVVLVDAAPRSSTFTVGGETFDLHHGMRGTAEARVHTERILFSLLPGLRVLFGGDRG